MKLTITSSLFSLLVSTTTSTIFEDRAGDLMDWLQQTGFVDKIALPVDKTHQ